MKGSLKEYRKNFVCLGLCFFLMSFNALADTAIGKVIFVKGSLTVSRNNQSSALNRGSDIFQGDTLTTGSGSESQIRFTDGGLLTLQADSQFRLNTYQNDAGEKKFSAEFLKGSFRAVSGIIGKSEPQNYEIQTGVATIGIRGTDYSATIDNRGELAAGVWSGKIILSNCAGETVIGEGQPYRYARVSSPNDLPQVLSQMPQILVTPIDVESNVSTAGSTSTDSKEICIQ